MDWREQNDILSNVQLLGLTDVAATTYAGKKFDSYQLFWR
jgi:hypothetical protein